jgi:hypothetical protein
MFDEILSFCAPLEAAAIPSILKSAFPTYSDSGEGESVLRRRKTALFQPRQLESLARQYRTGEPSIQEICALVTDATGYDLNSSEKPVRDYWEQHGIAWHGPRGRLWATVPPEVETVIMELASDTLKRGVKKMHATLQLPQYDHLPRFSVEMLERFLIREIDVLGVGKEGSAKISMSVRGKSREHDIAHGSPFRPQKSDSELGYYRMD